MTPPKADKSEIAAPFNPRTRQRQEQLVDAMAGMLSEGKLPATLADLAKAAGMSTATAYRYYQSLDEVSQAYLVRIMTQVRDFSVLRDETGAALLYAITRYWISIVVEHGPVLVQVRSRRGFLERLDQNVKSTALGVEARRRALLGVLAENHMPASLIEDAAMLYNTLFDPREILDLMNVRTLDQDRVTHLLITSFLGALKGWYLGLVEDVSKSKGIQP
jgi:AcrR family transcriptional regulator